MIFKLPHDRALKPFEMWAIIHILEKFNRLVPCGIHYKVL